MIDEAVTEVLTVVLKYRLGTLIGEEEASRFKFNITSGPKLLEESHLSTAYEDLGLGVLWR